MAGIRMPTARRRACCTCRRRSRTSRWCSIRRYTPNPVGYNLGIDFGAQLTYYKAHPEAPNKFVGYLQAMDPKTGKKVWGGPENQGPTGGAVATAGGLVFQGGGSSDAFRAFDAQTGKVLWTGKTQTAVLAAPITYELDGKQYVAVSVGGRGAGRRLLRAQSFAHAGVHPRWHRPVARRAALHAARAAATAGDRLRRRR